MNSTLRHVPLINPASLFPAHDIPNTLFYPHPSYQAINH